MLNTALQLRQAARPLLRFTCAQPPRFSTVRTLTEQAQSQASANLDTEKPDPIEFTQVFNQKPRKPTIVQIEGSSPWEKGPTAGYIEDFKRLSRQRVVEGDEILHNNLERIFHQLSVNVKTLTHKEMLEFVEALTCWPEAVRQNSALLQVPTATQQLIRDLYLILQRECTRRIYRPKCEEEVFMSCSYDQLDGLLNLCEIWLKIDKIKTFNSNSFPVLVINKVGHINHSSSRFRRFSKDTFVKFIRVMGRVPLGEEFHRYYCTFKFIDLFDEMTGKDIADVCRTFVKHDIRWNTSHPTEHIIRKKILDFLLNTRLADLDTADLVVIAKYVGLNCPDTIVKEAKEVQTLIVNDTDLMEGLDIQALIHIAAMSSRLNMVSRDGVDYTFWDKTVAKMLACNVEDLTAFSMVDRASLAVVTAIHRDTPASRLLLWKLVEDAVSLEEGGFGNEGRHALTLMLCLAHVGLYHHEATEQLMTNPNLVTAGGDGLQAAKPIQYCSTNNRFTGGHLLSFQGMLDLECPDYVGPKITSRIDKFTLAWIDSVKPTEASEELENKHWVSTGKKLYGALSMLYGEGTVYEGYVMPFSGLLSYCVIFNSDGLACPVPEWLTSLPDHVNKPFRACQDQTALLLSSIHPSRARQITLRCGGLHVRNRLAARLGYKHVWIDQEKLMSLSTQDEVVRYIHKEVRTVHPTVMSSLKQPPV